MNGKLRFSKIVKRNGEIAEFSVEKIEHAIFKTMRTVIAKNLIRRITGNPHLSYYYHFSNFRHLSLARIFCRRTP